MRLKIASVEYSMYLLHKEHAAKPSILTPLLFPDPHNNVESYSASDIAPLKQPDSHPEAVSPHVNVPEEEKVPLACFEDASRLDSGIQESMYEQEPSSEPYSAPISIRSVRSEPEALSFGESANSNESCANQSPPHDDSLMMNSQPYSEPNLSDNRSISSHDESEEESHKFLSASSPPSGEPEPNFPN